MPGSLRSVAVIVCAGCLLFALTLTACSDQADLQADWQSARHRAFEYLRDGKFQQASDQYKTALAMAERFGPEDKRLAITLNELARTYALQGDPATASVHYKRALNILGILQERTNVSNDGKELVTQLIDALEGLANASEKENKPEQADGYYQRALNVLSLAGEPTRKRQILYEYRGFLSSQGKQVDVPELNDAEKNLEQAAQLPNRGDALHEAFSHAMRNCDAKLRENNVTDATTFAWEAVAAAQKLNNRALLAGAQTQLAYLYSSQQNTAMAEQSFRSALENYEAAAASDKQMYVCLLGYSRLLVKEHRIKEAESYGLRVLQYAEENHSADERELIDCLTLMSEIYATSGDLKRAIATQERLLKLTRAHSQLTRADVVMHTCYLTNLLYMAGMDQKGRSVLQSYISDSKRVQMNVLPAKLFSDFAEACLKQSNKPEAKEFFRAALVLSKRTPDGAKEAARAQNRLSELH
jgi:tetratricopeptide (TPR) repeat protein